MGEFIKVTIDYEKCGTIEEIKKWAGVCPVNIFEIKENKAVVKPENEDECTLCNLCLDNCTSGAVTISKLY